jgi:hypothetical protein
MKSLIVPSDVSNLVVPMSKNDINLHMSAFSI